MGSKSLARQVYHKRKTEVRESRFFPPSRGRPREITLADAVADYLDRKRATLRHFRHYIRFGRYWTEAFGTRPLGAIIPADIEAYVAQRAKQAKPATVNRELAFLKRLYNDTIDNGRVETNPVRKVKLFRENNARVRFLSEDEEARLKTAIPERFWPFVVFALHTGLRQAEQFALRWENVDFENKTITIPRAKHGEARRVPMNQAVIELLLREKSKYDTGDFTPLERRDLVFPGRGGRPLDAGGFTQRIFRPAAEAAGVENFTWHDLRHTFASRLVMKGVDLRTVQELMGHKAIAMTLRYAHLSPGHLAEAVQRLSLGSTPPPSSSSVGDSYLPNGTKTDTASVGLMTASGKM